MKRIMILTVLQFALSANLSVSAECQMSSKSAPVFPIKEYLAKSSKKTLNETRAQEIIQEIQAIYSSIFELKGLKLTISLRWKENRANAFATRDLDDNPIVQINGGLVRHPLMTDDALRAVICHEIGHHLGGAPKAFRGDTTKISWSSAEGQADYFASSKCLRKVFKNYKKKIKIPSVYKEVPCKNKNCSQILKASHEAALLYAQIDMFPNQLDIKKKDITIVNKTNRKHVKAQCRLDTLVSGAQCNRSEDSLFDDHDHNIGACTLAYGDLLGTRPKCWFNPEK